jgi:manganese transport system substrate-binding protein
MNAKNKRRKNCMLKKIAGMCLSGLILLAAATGCSTEKEKSDKVEVVATYSIIYDLVKNVGGDKVEVHSMVPIGANPHEYDPLPEDVKKMTDADVVFYNGLNLEEGNSWFEKLLQTSDKDGKDAPVYRVSERVEPIHLESKGLEKEPDPHAWLNIQNGIIYVENIRDALMKEDPDHKEYYEKNAEAYITELRKLHDETLTELSSIPEEQRILITSEGAFKYFGEAYQMDTAYIWEINSENQGTPQQIKDLVDFINQGTVPALFVETSVDPRSMETVAKETGVPIKGKVFTDSLGKPGDDGDTYKGMMEWNTKTVINGLK